MKNWKLTFRLNIDVLEIDAKIVLFNAFQLENLPYCICSTPYIINFNSSFSLHSLINSSPFKSVQNYTGPATNIYKLIN